MNFKKIKATFCLLSLLVLVVACESKFAPSIEQVNERVEQNKRYDLSNNYAKHRAQQHFFKSSGGNIAYLDYGQGPTIVMLHGVPSSSWLYRKMIASLQGQFRIVAIDLLGFGSSDKPKSNTDNYLASSQASYVTQLLNHLGVEQYHLLFHDMGGLVAWELTTQSIKSKSVPAVSNLIVLNTIIDQHGFEHPHLKKGVVARMMSDAFANQLSSAAVLDMTFNNMGLTSNAKLSESECRGYVVPMKEGNGDVLYDFYTGFDDHQFARLRSQVSALSEFDGDVLVLWGAEDKVLTTAQIPVLQKSVNIKKSNIHIFNDNAHFLPEEIPQKLEVLIREFLTL